jgi:nicotinic acid mononucleotide adenylyltransferase
MWYDKVKEAGINIHVIATGAGAGIQQELWEIPGSSAYLGGASFPYATEETDELLGFTPKSYCSQETAIDLASAAYMRAYKFGGKKPVGIGLTASVASEREHRGDHRIFTCVMTDENVLFKGWNIKKGIGFYQRMLDGKYADMTVFKMLNTFLPQGETGTGHPTTETVDVSALAKERFFAHPFFTASGQRLEGLPCKKGAYYPYHPYALMPGAFNPPHEGHFGTAEAMLKDHGRVTVYEITAEPPHKDALSTQQLLQRAKLLHGRDRIFTQKEPFYLDKARTFGGMPLVLGADAMVRMLDPKWGHNVKDMLDEFSCLHTKLYISGREINGKFTTRDDIEKSLPEGQRNLFHYLSASVSGKWDISSTEIRNATLAQLS